MDWKNAACLEFDKMDEQDLSWNPSDVELVLETVATGYAQTFVAWAAETSSVAALFFGPRRRAEVQTRCLNEAPSSR